MKLRALVIAAALGVWTLPAAANQCPADMRKIDAALAQNTQLSDAEKARVQELRALGEQQHESGDHAASVETLGQAKEILGIQ